MKYFQQLQNVSTQKYSREINITVLTAFWQYAFKYSLVKSEYKQRKCINYFFWWMLVKLPSSNVYPIISQENAQ